MADRYLRDSQIIATGWIPADETWTYSSSDSPIFVASVSGNQTSKYWAGQRVKLTQTTNKYFIIHAVSYSAPNTLITLFGGTDYTLTSATISDVYYSPVYAPAGFNTSPDKWTIRAGGSITNRVKTSPTAGTVYGNTNAWDSGVENLTFYVPIGTWSIYIETSLSGRKESSSLDVRMAATKTTSADGIMAIASGYDTIVPQRYPFIVKNIKESNKTLYYIVLATSQPSCASISFNYTIINLTSEYL